MKNRSSEYNKCEYLPDKKNENISDFLIIE